MFMIRKEDWGKVVSYRGKKGAIVVLWEVIPDEGKELLELQVNLISIQHSTEAGNSHNTAFSMI